MAVVDQAGPRPFLKWAGGKRWFVQDHGDILPTRFNNYIEPFLGSGAVFFHLRPKNALLGDTNPALIQTYRALREDWRLVYRYLRAHQRNHSEHYYYHVRASNPRSTFGAAARFIYLNRTCWNGLYRVNQRGVFNVPIGDRSSVLSEDDCFSDVAEALKDVQLEVTDFEFLVDKAESNDFVFVDPPYTVLHNHNAFIKYNEKLFSWFDQQRLFYALKRAKNRGAIIVGTNAYHDSVFNMYRADFQTFSVERNSRISSKVSSRRRFEELLFLAGGRT